MTCWSNPGFLRDVRSHVMSFFPKLVTPVNVAMQSACGSPWVHLYAFIFPLLPPKKNEWHCLLVCKFSLVRQFGDSDFLAYP